MNSDSWCLSRFSNCGVGTSTIITDDILMLFDTSTGTDSAS